MLKVGPKCWIDFSRFVTLWDLLGTITFTTLVQDIVTESASFDLATFMPLLRERLYTKNVFARQFIISWISVLHAVPDINMIIFLPDLLDGLLNILEDPTVEIKKMCVISVDFRVFK